MWKNTVKAVKNLKPSSKENDNLENVVVANPNAQQPKLKAAKHEYQQGGESKKVAVKAKLQNLSQKNTRRMIDKKLKDVDKSNIIATTIPDSQLLGAPPPAKNLESLVNAAMRKREVRSRMIEEQVSPKAVIDSTQEEKSETPRPSKRMYALGAILLVVLLAGAVVAFDYFSLIPLGYFDSQTMFEAKLQIQELDDEFVEWIPGMNDPESPYAQALVAKIKPKLIEAYKVEGVVIEDVTFQFSPTSSFSIYRNEPVGFEQLQDLETDQLPQGRNSPPIVQTTQKEYSHVQFINAKTQVTAKPSENSAFMLSARNDKWDDISVAVQDSMASEGVRAAFSDLKRSPQFLNAAYSRLKAGLPLMSPPAVSTPDTRDCSCEHSATAVKEMKYICNCKESCARFPYLNILGGIANIFSILTHICKAAFYAEIIPASGGKVEVLKLGKVDRISAGLEKFGILPLGIDWRDSAIKLKVPGPVVIPTEPPPKAEALVQETTQRQTTSSPSRSQSPGGSPGPGSTINPGGSFGSGSTLNPGASPGPGSTINPGGSPEPGSTINPSGSLEPSGTLRPAITDFPGNTKKTSKPGNTFGPSATKDPFSTSTPSTVMPPIRPSTEKAKIIQVTARPGLTEPDVATLHFGTRRIRTLFPTWVPPTEGSIQHTSEKGLFMIIITYNYLAGEWLNYRDFNKDLHTGKALEQKTHVESQWKKAVDELGLPVESLEVVEFYPYLYSLGTKIVFHGDMSSNAKVISGIESQKPKQLPIIMMKKAANSYSAANPPHYFIDRAFYNGFRYFTNFLKVLNTEVNKQARARRNASDAGK